MNTNIVLEILKNLSSIVSTILGILGILFETKKINGGINRIGKISLGCILVSVLVSLTSNYLETKDKEDADNEAKNRQDRIEKSIDRGSNIIEKINITYDIEFKSKDGDILEFKKKLRKNLEGIKIKQDVTNVRSIVEAAKKLRKLYIDTPGLNADGTPMDYYIYKKSPYYPQENISFMSDALNFHPIILSFFKNPINLNQYQLGLGGNFKYSGDLILSSLPYKIEYINKNKNYIGYNFNEDRLHAMQSVDFDKSILSESDGEIISIRDLAGSQFIFQFDEGNIEKIGNNLSYTCRGKKSDSIKDLDITYFNIDFGKGFKFNVPTKEFNKIIMKNNCAVYSYIFPKDYKMIFTMRGL